MNVKVLINRGYNDIVKVEGLWQDILPHITAAAPLGYGMLVVWQDGGKTYEASFVGDIMIGLTITGDNYEEA